MCSFVWSKFKGNKSQFSDHNFSSVKVSYTSLNSTLFKIILSNCSLFVFYYSTISYYKHHFCGYTYLSCYPCVILLNSEINKFKSLTIVSYFFCSFFFLFLSCDLGPFTDLFSQGYFIYKNDKMVHF